MLLSEKISVLWQEAAARCESPLRQLLLVSASRFTTLNVKRDGRMICNAPAPEQACRAADGRLCGRGACPRNSSKR